ncbi:MAG: hypothetical protein CTY32_06885 [Methylotenera sp.]|nr:MAG: hypothetical protein CTY32_06885 [Methylotenera sp.]
MSTLQKHLEEDLATLHELLYTKGPLPPRHVRSVASAIVRKWLVEGALNKLAHELSVKFELVAYGTSAVFDALPNAPEVNFFLAGGVNLNGLPIRSMYASRAPYTGNPPIPVDTPVEFFPPGKYLGSKRIYFEGNSFSAEQIITFVANKAGGVHLDLRREKPWQEQLEQAAAYMTFGNPNNETKRRIVELGEPGGPCMLVLPKERGNIWSCLEIEMLSAAQALLNVRCNGESLIIWGET